MYTISNIVFPSLLPLLKYSFSMSRDKGIYSSMHRLSLCFCSLLLFTYLNYTFPFPCLFHLFNHIATLSHLLFIFSPIYNVQGYFPIYTPLVHMVGTVHIRTVNLAKLNFKHLIEKQFSMIQI
jgi:hypothetical protein